MLLDSAHAGFELADEDAGADTEAWYSITAWRSPTICSPSSLRSDNMAEATSARSERIPSATSARSALRSDLVAKSARIWLTSDRTSLSWARIWRRS
jgi:hypothetical protein